MSDTQDIIASLRYIGQTLAAKRLAELDAKVAELTRQRSYERGARRLVTEVWHLVDAHMLNARSLAADAALDLRDEIDKDWMPGKSVIDALRPPCPTCGGSHQVPNPEWHPDDEGVIPHEMHGPKYLPCPDCVDGRMPFERMARQIAELHSGKPVTTSYLRGIE